MKKLFLIFGLLCGLSTFAQVPSIMRLAATDNPIILIIHKNDTCIFQPLYIQVGATCVTNFQSFDGMNYYVTNIWGLANAYVLSNQIKECGDSATWAYESPVLNNKLINIQENENIYFAITDNDLQSVIWTRIR